MIRFFKSLFFGLPEFRMRFLEWNEKANKHDLYLYPFKLEPDQVQSFGRHRRVIKNETFHETYIVMKSGHTYIVEESYKKVCRKLGK